MSHHQRLLDIAKRHLAPVAPIPARVAPDFSRIDPVKCLIFDVYGTLLISDRSPAFGDRDALLLEILETEGLETKHEKPAAHFHQRLQERLFSDRLSGAPSPEIDVRRIWKKVLGDEIDSETIERVALAYECLTHQVWPVPGLSSVLHQLQALGKPLGILSNAQFYTPIILEALLGQPLREFGFMQSLSFYSYESLESKPGPLMMQKLIGQLERLHLRPSETLIIGNDLNKDIIPANQQGFRTLLVAIDERSLTQEIDGGDSADSNQPHAIITQLDDLFQVI